MRKGIVGHWKSGSGQAVLEQVAMSEKWKGWVDAVATLFGGLDICALEVIVGKDGREWVIEVNDSALSLMGEGQEEDRRHISELVMSRMTFVQEQLKKQLLAAAAVPPPMRRESNSDEVAAVVRRESTSSASSSTTTAKEPTMTSATSTISSVTSAAAQSLIGGGNKLFSRQNSQPINNEKGGAVESDAELDTGISNLKKTFAGIFGDM